MPPAPDSQPQPDAMAGAQAQIERLTKEFEDIKRSLAQLKQITRPDPAMALVRARKILEYVVSDLFRRHVAEPLGTRPLENLIERLAKEKVIDLHIKAYMDAVRGLGNAAAHGHDATDFSEDDVIRALDALLVVLDWYFKKEQIGDIEQLRQQVNADESSIQQYRVRVRGARQIRASAQKLRQYGGLAAIVILAAALAGMHSWFGIGPPWPPPMQTFLFSLLAMCVAWFANDIGVQQDLVPRRAPRWLIVWVGASLVLFLTMMALFTIPAPSWPNLESRGLWLQEPIAKVIEDSHGAITLEDEFEGATYNPLAIWVPWTVGLVRGVMLLLWLALVAGLAALADCFWWSIQEDRYDATLPA
jgi:hypothetical protein